MNAKIYSNKDCIGAAKLLVGDLTMGGLFGTFLPNESYFRTVQKEVWNFWESTEVNYTRWNSLRINVQLENGFFLFPVGGYTIEDSPEFPKEPKRIDISGIHHQVITDFMNIESPRPFVEEPWSELRIEQKIAFEDELKKELESPKYPIPFFSKHRKHLLNGATFSATCHDQRSDAVLFEINGNDMGDSFALVHLTWKNKPEIEKYPNTELYHDFDQFKRHRMYPDKADWED